MYFKNFKVRFKKKRGGGGECTKFKYPKFRLLLSFLIERVAKRERGQWSVVYYASPQSFYDNVY